MLVTTKNQGNGQADPSVTRFYLSANTVLDAGDLVITGEQPVPVLLPGGSIVTSVSIEIPSGTATGRHYVIARADDEDVLFETNENNNTRSRSVQVGPDLDVSAFTAPSAVAAGATISVTDTVTNAGAAGAPATAATFYLSTNSSLGAGDVSDRQPCRAGAGSRDRECRVGRSDDSVDHPGRLVLCDRQGRRQRRGSRDKRDEQHVRAFDQDRERPRDFGADRLRERRIEPDAERQRHHDKRRLRRGTVVGHAVLPVVEQRARCGRHAARQRAGGPAARRRYQQRRRDSGGDSGDDTGRLVLRHRQGRRGWRDRGDLRNQQHAGQVRPGRERSRRDAAVGARQGRRRHDDRRERHDLE